jgi:hypothetical protein
MKEQEEPDLPPRLDDTDILYVYEIKPADPNWRELMLDLGIPLETQWSLSVSVGYSRSTEEPLQFEVLENVDFHMDCPFLSDEYKAEIERVQPLYVGRTRSFFFDHRPTRDEVPPLSSPIPEIPCLENKHRRYVRWEPGDPPTGTMAFYCPGDTFEEVIQSVQSVHRGYVCSRYWGSGKNPTRSGWFIEQIRVWTQQAIEKMAQDSKRFGKIQPYSFAKFQKAFPYSTTRQSLYRLITEAERKTLKSRYLKRCAELMTGSN